jgi:hypothetical protein
MKNRKGQITVMHGVRDYKFNNIWNGKEWNPRISKSSYAEASADKGNIEH